MTDAALVDPGTERSASTWTAAIPGVLFVATFVIAMLIFTTPDDTASDSTWVAYLADRGHRVAIVVSAYLLVVAALALVVFLTRLYRRVGADGRDPLVPLAAGAAGILIALGGLAFAAIPGSTVFGSQPSPSSADVIRLSFSIGYPLLLVGAPFALGGAILLITLQARRAQYFGTAMTIFGYVAVVACLAAVFFLPLIVVMLWVLTASVILVRRPAAATPAAVLGALAASAGVDGAAKDGAREPAAVSPS